MATERTFSIIKPDAVEANNVGNILAMIEGAGLKIKAMRLVHLSRPMAEGFYAVHSHRPFFGELVDFMTRGPVVVSVLDESQPGEAEVAAYVYPSPETDYATTIDLGGLAPERSYRVLFEVDDEAGMGIGGRLYRSLFAHS